MKSGRIICCVCKVDMGECKGIKEDEVSHGYCPICFKIAMDEIEALEIKGEEYEK